MLVCDRCEWGRGAGEIKVEAVGVTIKAGGEPLIRGDLCSNCKVQLERIIKEFFKPLPKNAVRQ